MDMLPALGETALYLDLDGTLVPLAARPEMVRLPASTARLLLHLHQACHGAVALISGRDRASLRQACDDLPLAMISSHGAAMHGPQGEPHWHAAMDAAGHRRLEQAVIALIRPHALVWMERKAHGVAVHFRQRPELGDELHASLTTLCSEHPGFSLTRGHCVIELRLAGFDKGLAIARAQQHAPFAGRRPVMIGDDLTDEAAFRLVNEQEGVSIRIGPGEPDSAAQFYLRDPAALLALLRQWLAAELPPSRPVSHHCPAAHVAAP